MFYIQMHYTLYKLSMATTGDSTDPRGTKRPNKDPILVSLHIFRPIIVAEYPCKVCLPSNIYSKNVYGIFSLFFNNEVLSVLVKNTNFYKARHYKGLKTAWKNTSVTELRAFLGILIYRSLYPHPKHRELWNTNINKPIYTALARTLSYTQFTQLEATIHISDPDIKENIFSKLEPINLILLATYKVLWQPSSALAVNKCMSRFIEHIKKKITISTKPILTGIKAWIFADNNYFVHWF